MAVDLNCRKWDYVVTCIEPQGRKLQVPIWMTSVSASQCKVSDAVTISAPALLTLCDLIARANQEEA